MSDITIAGDYRPLGHQQSFHDMGPLPITYGVVPSPIKYRALISGIGGGKSLANVIECMRWLASYPGCSGIIVSPTLQQAKKSIIVELLTQCRLSEGFLLSYNKSDQVMEFANGSTLYLGHANEPDTLRGPNLSFFAFDEAGQVQDDGEAFRILMGRIRDPRYPTGGWISTTPRGKNWLYRTFELRQDQKGEPLVDADDYVIIHARTEDNTHLDPTYAASLRSQYSGEFARQELDGSFVSFEGLVYPGLSSRLGVLRDEDVVRYVAGFDWGWTHPSSLIVVGQDRNGRLGVIEETVETNLPLETSDGSRSWVELVKRADGRHRLGTVYCDPSAPAVISSLNRNGIHAVAADNAVLPGISAVTAAMSNGLVIHPDCTHLLKELDGYEWAKSRDGKIKQDAVNKVNDDACDSLRYAVVSFSRSASASPRVAPIRMRRTA